MGWEQDLKSKQKPVAEGWGLNVSRSMHEGWEQNEKHQKPQDSK